MQYRRLGQSGLLVSEIGLGTNNFGSRLDEQRTREVLERALEMGVTFIDTADIYADGQSETLIGRILGDRRDQVVLATKFGMSHGESPYERGASRRWIFKAVEGSLRRLRTDHIDLYQVHAPDPGTPIEETLGALDDLVHQGKVRYVGHSNFDGWQIADADWTARTGHLARPVSSQSYYNLLRRSVRHEVLPACRHFGLGLIPFFPLESGFLSGKYRPGRAPEGSRLAEGPRADSVLTEANFQRVAALEGFAAERGHTVLELALGWLLGQPEVSTVIAGASRPEQVTQNVESSSWRLAPDDNEALEKLLG